MLRYGLLIVLMVMGSLDTPSAEAQRFRMRGMNQGGGVTAPSATIKLSARRIMMDDDLTVELRLAGEFDRIEEPSFEGFEVVGRQNSQQVQYVNGQMSRQQVVTLELRPERPGQFIIEPLRLFLGGNVVAQSKRVSIKVDGVKDAAPTTASASRDLDARASEELFIQVETDRDQYFVGEPFIIRSRIFFRRDLGVNSLEYISEPKLEGLLAEELLDRSKSPRPKDKRLRGQRFRYVDHSMRLATGLKAGTVIIDPTVVRVQTGGIFRSKRQTIRSRPFPVQILPLPTQGRPASFRDGNIGLFSMRASLSNADGSTPKRVQTGERLILDVKVGGRGSLVGVKPPQLDSDANFSIERLPDTSEDLVEKNESGMTGSRLFRFIVSPRKAGTHALPDVVFGYFDPEAEEYKEHRWTSMPLTISGRSVLDQQRVSEFNQSDIAPNVDASALKMSPIDHDNPLRSPLVWLLFGAPLLGLFWVEGRHWSRRSQAKNPAKRRSAHAAKHARRALDNLSRTQGTATARDFYSELSKLLVTYLESRTGRPLMGLTHHELLSTLGSADVPTDVLEVIQRELEHCDFACYAPDADSGATMVESQGRVEGLIKRFEDLDIEVAR